MVKFKHLMDLNAEVPIITYAIIMISVGTAIVWSIKTLFQISEVFILIGLGILAYLISFILVTINVKLMKKFRFPA
ncbi:MAG: hypothetical protein ACFFCQ_03730 [Promethearchaeota archaeon]